MKKIYLSNVWIDSPYDKDCTSSGDFPTLSEALEAIWNSLLDPGNKKNFLKGWATGEIGVYNFPDDWTGWDDDKYWAPEEFLEESIIIDLDTYKKEYLHENDNEDKNSLDALHETQESLKNNCDDEDKFEKLLNECREARAWLKSHCVDQFSTISDGGAVAFQSGDFKVSIPNGYGDCRTEVFVIDYNPSIPVKIPSPLAYLNGKTSVLDYDCEGGVPIRELNGRYGVTSFDAGNHGVVVITRYGE